MRMNRTAKLKIYRQKRNRKILFFGIVVPSASVFLGYLVTTLIILPGMGK